MLLVGTRTGRENKHSVCCTNNKRQYRYFVLIVGGIMKNMFRVLFFVVALIFVLAGCPTQATELSSDFINQVYDSVNESGMVDFIEVTDFEWEQLVFISPYMTVNSVLEEVGANWARPITHIQHSDVNTLLLFINENDVVAFVHFPRNKLDFVQIIQRNRFSRSDATFMFDVTE
jgi:hypothetical protein